MDADGICELIVDDGVYRWTDGGWEKLGIDMADEMDAQAQLQLAYTLGTWNNALAGRTLARMAQTHGSDDYFAAAVMSSARHHLDHLAAELVGSDEGSPSLANAVLKSVVASGKSGDDFVGKTLDRLGRGDIGQRQLEAVAVLLEANANAGNRTPNVQRMAPFRQAARIAVSDTSKTVAERVSAVRVLAFGEGEDLEEFLLPELPFEVQQAAVDAIVRWGDTLQIMALLKGWKHHGPSLRSKIATGLAGRPDGHLALFRHFKKEPSSVALFQGAASELLLRHPDASVRKRAQEFFKPDFSRERVIARYREALSSTALPDVRKGREVFAKNCANCHILDDFGKEAGPDLAALTDKSDDALRVAILDPNRAVEDKFQAYVVRLRDGQALAGIITVETSTSFTLTLADGSRKTVLRKNLTSIENTGRSLMPEGLEGAITPDEMHQLIAYIAEPRAKRREFPGNVPKRLGPDANGTLDLHARNAWIYGTQIALEEKYGNLGMWGHAGDHAVWNIDVTTSGRYRVECDFACHDDTAGNAFQIIARSGGPGLKGKVPGTGTWDQYQTKGFGEIELKAGPQRIEFRPEGKMKGFLIDLRRLILTPLNK